MAVPDDPPASEGPTSETAATTRNSADELLDALASAETVGGFRALLRSNVTLAGELVAAFRRLLESRDPEDAARLASAYRVALEFVEQMRGLPDDTEGVWNAAALGIAATTLECLPPLAGSLESVRLAMTVGLSRLEAFGASSAEEDLESSLEPLLAAATCSTREIPDAMRDATWSTFVGALQHRKGDRGHWIDRALAFEPPPVQRAELLGTLAGDRVLAAGAGRKERAQGSESTEFEQATAQAVGLYEQALAGLDRDAHREAWRKLAEPLALLLGMRAQAADAARAQHMLEELIPEHTGEEERESLPNLYCGLATAHGNQGHRAEALAAIDSAIRIAGEVGTPAIEVAAYHALRGDWLDDGNEFEAAIAAYELAARTLGEERWAHGSTESPFELTEKYHGIFRGLSRCHLACGRAAEAVGASAHGRARALDERLAYRGGSPVDGVPDDLWNAARLARDAHAHASEAGDIPDLERREAEYGDALARLESSSPAASRILRLEPLEAADVCRQLEPHQALLVLYPTRQELCAFGLSPSTGAAKVVGTSIANWRVGELASHVLGEWVVAYENYRAGEANVEEVCAALERTLESLAARCDLSLLDDLLRGVTHLLIVAHYPLTALPLQLLRLPSGERLIDRVTVSFLPSLSGVVRPRPRAISADTPLLGVFDPVPEGPSRLEYARFERAAIESRFTQTTSLSGNAATWGRVRDLMFQNRVAHFSCHGHHDFTTDSRSWLELARGERVTPYHLLVELAAVDPSERESALQILAEAPPGGNLAAFGDERASLEPFDMDLLVLSACESGLSEMLKFGDEYWTLPAMLHVAGARAVVASFWRVRDRVCMFLFDAFCRELVDKGGHPAGALRAAQQWLREATGAELADVAERLIEAEGNTSGTAALQLWIRSQRAPGRRHERPYARPFFSGAFFHLGA